MKKHTHRFPSSTNEAMSAKPFDAPPAPAEPVEPAELELAFDLKALSFLLLCFFANLGGNLCDQQTSEYSNYIPQSIGATVAQWGDIVGFGQSAVRAVVLLVVVGGTPARTR